MRARTAASILCADTPPPPFSTGGIIAELFLSMTVLTLQALVFHRQFEEVPALLALRAVPEVLLVAVDFHDGAALALVGAGGER